jgi:hypothetical protein
MYMAVSCLVDIETTMANAKCGWLAREPHPLFVMYCVGDLYKYIMIDRALATNHKG